MLPPQASPPRTKRLVRAWGKQAHRPIKKRASESRQHKRRPRLPSPNRISAPPPCFQTTTKRRKDHLMSSKLNARTLPTIEAAIFAGRQADLALLRGDYLASNVWWAIKVHLLYGRPSVQSA